MCTWGPGGPVPGHWQTGGFLAGFGAGRGLGGTILPRGRASLWLLIRAGSGAGLRGAPFGCLRSVGYVNVGGNVSFSGKYASGEPMKNPPGSVTHVTLER